MQPNRLPGVVHDPATLKEPFSLALLGWFAKAARDLPWRHTTDAYRIWVSEVMLQQTQVKTVVGYYQPFIDLFPTITDLAAATEERVLRAWEGLGYYRRARGLHQAAGRLVEMGYHNLPPDPAVLTLLPGMGEYTRNAVLSQAYRLPLPIVEANSQRVLARLLGVDDDPARGPVRKWLWQASAALVPQHDPGAFNQALMELGSLICTPTKPGCLVCPARPWCAAAASGSPEAIPRKSPRPAVTRVEEVALVVRQGDRWLFARRPASASRWAGLWEFPHREILAGSTGEATLAGLMNDLFGLAAPSLLLGTVRHSITRYQVAMAAYLLELPDTPVPCLPDHDAHAWLHAQQVATTPLSAPQRRLWQLVNRG